MKTPIKKSLLALALLISLSGCYKEPDFISDLVTSNGKIAQISAFWIEGTTRLTTRTVPPSTTVNIVVEYISEIPVKEIRVYSGATAAAAIAATTPLATQPASVAVYDPILRNYVVKFPITVSATTGSTTIIATEVITTNDLPTIRKTVTLKT